MTKSQPGYRFVPEEAFDAVFKNRCRTALTERIDQSATLGSIDFFPTGQKSVSGEEIFSVVDYDLTFLVNVVDLPATEFAVVGYTTEPIPNRNMWLTRENYRQFADSREPAIAS